MNDIERKFLHFLQQMGLEKLTGSKLRKKNEILKSEAEQLRKDLDEVQAAFSAHKDSVNVSSATETQLR